MCPARRLVKMKIGVPEVVEVFREVKKQPEKLFEMIRFDIKETLGQYLTTLMKAKLTHFLGREPYERSRGEVNQGHRLFAKLDVKPWRKKCGRISPSFKDLLIKISYNRVDIAKQEKKKKRYRNRFS